MTHDSELRSVPSSRGLFLLPGGLPRLFCPEAIDACRLSSSSSLFCSARCLSRAMAACCWPAVRPCCAKLSMANVRLFLLPGGRPRLPGTFSCGPVTGCLNKLSFAKASYDYAPAGWIYLTHTHTQQSSDTVKHSVRADSRLNTCRACSYSDALVAVLLVSPMGTEMTVKLYSNLRQGRTWGGLQDSRSSSSYNNSLLRDRVDRQDNRL